MMLELTLRLADRAQVKTLFEALLAATDKGSVGAKYPSLELRALKDAALPQVDAFLAGMDKGVEK